MKSKPSYDLKENSLEEVIATLKQLITKTDNKIKQKRKAKDD